MSLSALRHEMSSTQADYVSKFLSELGDAALFAGTARKVDGKQERLLIITKCRLVILRWKTFGAPQRREHRLVDLAGVAGQGDSASWTFVDDECATLRLSRLQTAVHATLQAHARLTLCLDRITPLHLQV